jgi:hypothetical protein
MQLHDARARHVMQTHRYAAVYFACARTNIGTHAHAFMHACHGGNGAARLPACLPAICRFALRPALTERAVLYSDRTTLKSTELRRQ